MRLNQVLIGISFAILIALVAWRVRSLSTSGAIAAVFVGGITFGFGGGLPTALLLTFFISSSLLSRIGGARKEAVATAFEKGGKRDYAQVLANGSIAAIFSIFLAITEGKFWLVGILGAFAAVTADTWSTELGVLAHRRPRLITTWKPVESGTSGGITLEGSLAGLLGAALIGIVAGVWNQDPRIFAAAALGGVLGASFDSLLGASVQGMYFCPQCEKLTERHPTHLCGETTAHMRGWPWLTNDLVNFLASFFGALASIGLWWVF